jgi:antibiotic biosynthesis monooxygenase (ABM) superfamily enzyme
MISNLQSFLRMASVLSHIQEANRPIGPGKRTIFTDWQREMKSHARKPPSYFKPNTTKRARHTATAVSSDS